MPRDVAIARKMATVYFPCTERLLCPRQLTKRRVNSEAGIVEHEFASNKRMNNYFVVLSGTCVMVLQVTRSGLDCMLGVEASVVLALPPPVTT